MLKNTQIQIIIIFTILGVVIITGMGILFSNQMEAFDNRIKTGEVTEVARNKWRNFKRKR